MKRRVTGRRMGMGCRSLIGYGLLLMTLILSACVSPAGTPQAATPTRPAVTPTRRPTPTPRIDPLVPTVIPATADARPGSTPTRLPTGTPLSWSLAPYPRFGVGVPLGKLSAEIAGWLGVGWYVTWSARTWDAPPGVEFWPMVRVSQTGFRPAAAELASLVAAHPGATWIAGNEPDVVEWQDDVPPRQYAEIYHDVYTLIKSADPTARVAIAAVSQPTELRLRYLDQVLEAYRSRYGEPMPVDVWTVHMYILNEQRDSWGTGIPPGFSEAVGELIEIDQHDDLAIFQRRLLRFRQWMAAAGYRERELAITEYGILMPPDYGFGPERVRRFMWATFDYFQTATDPQVGLPSDDNRLVQRWAWFSLYDPNYEGDLFDPTTGQLTPAGRDFAEYVRTQAK